MELPDDNSNWLFDLGLMEDIPIPDAHLPCLQSSFNWPHNPITPGSSHHSAEFEDSFETSDTRKECASKKRVRTGACGKSETKAVKEKMRRDKLNDKFQELSCVMEPGRPPKTDKAAILDDAVRMVIQLRDEAKKLKESSENMQAKVNELKAEKIELRDEKQKLKAEKEKLEQQVKGFMGPPHSKMMPILGYQGIPMWQFMPRAAVDTSEDHVLRPPVA